MLIKKPNDVPSSEITPKSTYMNRRRFMTGSLVTGAAVATGLYLRKNDDGQVSTPGSVEASGEKLSGIVKSQYSTTEKPTSLKDITNYNNYYEFSTDKYEPAGLSKNFRTRPWTVSLDGLVKKPRKIDIDSLLKIAPSRRTHLSSPLRGRLVHGGSVGWNSALSALIKQADPLPSAKFVAFETVMAPDQMPNQKRDVLQWPYVEGLRMDEAMHPSDDPCSWALR